MSLKCTIRVVEARGIKAADLNGKSDPYVKMNLKGSSKVQKTRVLYKTLSPIWNEDFIIDPVSQSDVLEVSLWDKDALRDDFLGELHIPLAAYLNNRRDEWKPITARQHGFKGSAFKMMTGAAPMKMQGEIHLQIYVGTGSPNSQPMMGGQMQQQNPYVSPTPYGQPPVNPYGQPPTNSYGQPPMNSYGQPPVNPYGQPPVNPYGQTPVNSYPSQNSLPQNPPRPQNGSMPPQYGLQSVAPLYPQNNNASQPPRPMQPSASAPPQYGLQSTAPPMYPQNNYGTQSQAPPQYTPPNTYNQQYSQPQQNGAYPNQYPQNTPSAQIPLPPTQYPMAMQPNNQYRDFDSGSQFPNQWGPKPDFQTLAQPNSYGPM